MLNRTGKRLLWVMVALLLGACSNEVPLDVEVRATLDGQVAPQARVSIDGVEVGLTDASGSLSKSLSREPGVEVRIAVAMDRAGYRIAPWEGAFVVRNPAKGQVLRYPLEAALTSTRYVTLAVTEAGAPLEGALVELNGEKVAETDLRGEAEVTIPAEVGKGLRLEVSKSGYGGWKKTLKPEAGDRVEAVLSKEARLNVSALTEEYGLAVRMPGVSVSVDGRRVGKTDSKGNYTYVYTGEPGKKVRVTLSAPGSLPAQWQGSVTLEGEKSLQRYFYPASPKPIRAAVYGYVNNTPTEDLSGSLRSLEDGVAVNLFSYLGFKEVPREKAQEEIRKAKLNVDQITAKGWQETRLARSVDMLLLGSVTKDERGFTIETKVFTSAGRLILSQINTARRERDIPGTAREIAQAVLARFPFEGTILAVEGERYQINLGKADYRMEKGMELALLSPVLDGSGKVKKFEDIGTFRVKKTEASASWGEVVELKGGAAPAVGDRVVRRLQLEEERKATGTSFVLQASGGVAPDVVPLRGVNIYLDDQWMGSTGADGTAEVPVKLGKKYDLLLYRHGYQKIGERLKVEKSGDRRPFVLAANNALFKVETDPAGAEILLDGTSLGRTPLAEGKPVPFGFHTLRLALGGDYRDWEEVLEFSQRVEDYTGPRRITLYKDYLRLGREAEGKGSVEGAIAAYGATESAHPDYSLARQALARLYMDEKKDFSGAIREFENVLALPQNQQLIFKQFAVTYTNLGHAYYERGNARLQQDREGAAQDLAKAVQNLQVAKQNTRFFPSEAFDEAVHDTYYYLALATHKIYLLTRKENIQERADQAWREYFDFFPKALEGRPAFESLREAGRQYWAQVKG